MIKTKQKKLLITIVIVISLNYLSFSQSVGISATGALPADCSMLDIFSGTKGLLIPRVALTNVTTYLPLTGTAVDGMIVYSTANPTGGSGTGFYYWSTVATAHWVNIADNFGTGTPWILDGNTGINDPGTPVTYGTSLITAGENWVGTTDAQDLVFGTDTKERMRVLKTSGFVGIGTAAPSTLFHIDGGASATQTLATITGNSLTSGKGLVVSTSNASFTGNVIEAISSGASIGAAWGVLARVNSTGAAAGVRAESQGITGANYGIDAQNASRDGYAIRGINTSTTTATAASYGGRIAAVYAETQAANTIGVFGYASNNTAQGVGLWGAGNHSTSIGIIGIGNAQTLTTLAAGAGGYFIGSTYGSYSKTSIDGGTGVFGINTSTGTGSQYGIYGSKTGATGTGTGYGVYGTATGTGTNNIGAYFTASGATNNYGLLVPSGGGNVGIGTIAPSAKSLLHVAGTTGGVLVPNMTGAQRVAIAPAATDYGLLVYQTDVVAGPPALQAGYWYWDGTTWNMFLDNSTPNGGWSLLGNSGTVAATNYIGTNDVQDFIIRTSAVINTPLERVRVLTTGQVGVNMTPAMMLDATWNTTVADNAVIRGASTGNARVYGVLGTTTSITANASGLRGYASGASGGTNGVWGESSSTAGTGVYGLATAANGDGIYGYNSAAAGAGSGSGVYGYSNQALGAGIYGNGGTNSAGVFGVSAKSHVWNSAVYGENSNVTSGTGWAYDQVTCGVSGRATGTAVYATGVYGYNNNSTVNDNAAVYGQDGQTCFGALAFTYTPAATQRTLGVYGRTNGNVEDRGIQAAFDATADGSWGYIGGVDRGSYAQLDANHYGGLGSADYGAYGVNNAATAGTAYNATKEGVYGRTGGGAAYNFGIVGYDAGSTNRTGGVMGAFSSTVWASNGYQSSGGATYGLYSTATAYNGTTNTNGGFMEGNNNVLGIGNGSYGGIIGSWTKGDVMGHISAGELFASYNLGNAFTSGYQAEIVTLAEKRVAAFSVTSTEIEVYNAGKAQLSMGKTRVNFKESFSELIADDEPVVTITPMGPCNGIYISNVDSKGFDVIELNNGNSNVRFSYIVIGKRIDAGNKSELPEALAKKDFDEKIKGVMFNENNLERSATPVWWDGTKVRFDTPPESIIGKKEDGNKNKLSMKK